MMSAVLSAILWVLFNLALKSFHSEDAVIKYQTALNLQLHTIISVLLHSTYT